MAHLRKPAFAAALVVALGPARAPVLSGQSLPPLKGAPALPPRLETVRLKNATMWTQIELRVLGYHLIWPGPHLTHVLALVGLDSIRVRPEPYSWARVSHPSPRSRRISSPFPRPRTRHRVTPPPSSPHSKSAHVPIQPLAPSRGTGAGMYCSPRSHGPMTRARLR